MRLVFDPCQENPRSRKWQPTPVFLPGKFYGQRSLGAYSPWGHKESDMTESVHAHTHTHTHTDCAGGRTQLCLNTQEMAWIILVSQTARFWHTFNKGSSWHVLTSFKNRNLGAGIKATHFLLDYKFLEGQAHFHNHHAPSTILNTLCSWNMSR